MPANFGGWHFLIILLVVLLLFGASKLPQLAKSLGQSAKILKNEVRDLHDEPAKPAAQAAQAPVANEAAGQPSSDVASDPAAPSTPNGDAPRA